MRARSVLGTARAAAVGGRAAADKQVRLDVAEVRDYASLLGDERAEEFAGEQERTLAAMAAAPAAAKMAVGAAFAVQRGAKDFGKKDKS
jgi:hypothetical protein